MSYEAPVLTASRILNASRVAQAADDTGVTGWMQTDEFILVAQIDEEKGPWNVQYTLRWRDVTDSGSFADLASSGEIAWGTNTDLTNGNPVVIGEKACTNTPTGSSWQDGEEVEGACTCDSIDLADEYYTEVHFACDPTNAQYAHEYEFQLWDENNGAAIGTLLATLTISNGLLGNLIAYWPGNETSGDALDAHTNDLDLDDINTVTYGTGNVYTYARQYTAANYEYHTRPGDDAELSLGSDSDFTIAVWLNFDSVGSVTKFILLKRLSSSDLEYQIDYAGTDWGGDNRIWFMVWNGIDVEHVAATSLGLPSVGTWYLIVAWHDHTDDVLRIQANNGTVDSQAWSGGTRDGSGAFRLGATWLGELPMDGRIGPTAFWKGLLTAGQRTALYNSGSGLAYSDFEALAGPPPAGQPTIVRTWGIPFGAGYRSRGGGGWN